MAREVGTEGKLGGQAAVPDVSGTWRDLTENVNQLAGNLTAQVRNIAQVTTAVARGDLSQKITVDARGEILELKSTVNTMVDQLSSVRRRGHPGGPRGGHRGQAGRPGRGAGRGRHLARPHRQRQLHGVEPDRPGAQHRPGHHGGGAGRPVAEDHRGRPGRDPGAQVDRQHDGRPAVLVRRRGHPGGPRGGHRGQAGRPGRGQGRRRHLARPHRERQPAGRQPHRRRCATSPRSPRRWRRATCRRRSPWTPGARSWSSSSTVNTMVDQLSSFADEVTRVAREVGTEGKLGGQAEVKGVAGTWRDLTENVNQLAVNLTGQVRNIAQVTTAVARGDLSPEDHRRRPRRDPGAQDHRQHDGRPALLVRRRGHPGGPRGRHRGQARRPGPGPRRVRHLARPHRERQPARLHADHPAARDLRGVHRRWPAAT